MSIRRRKIAHRLLNNLMDEGTERARIAEQVLNSPSRMSRYIEYHLKRHPANASSPIVAD